MSATKDSELVSLHKDAPFSLYYVILKVPLSLDVNSIWNVMQDRKLIGGERPLQ